MSLKTVDGAVRDLIVHSCMERVLLQFVAQNP